MKDNNDNYDSLVESIGRLMDMQDSDNDRCAAGLFRAMFRHETDLNKLDNQFADNILGYAESGCNNAVEDYKNYLQYIKTICPSVYPEYKEMFKNTIIPKEEELEE